MTKKELTVNFHLLEYCNYRCRYCYSHFKDLGYLKHQELCRIIDNIADAGFVRKINFAGGEPLLLSGIGEILMYTKQKGFIVSIITNGYHLNDYFLEKYGKYIDIIGISCDSQHDDVMEKIGRSSTDKKAVSVVIDAIHAIDRYNKTHSNTIKKKINSVVTSLNKSEDMISFIRKLSPERWKIFQVLPIHGENDTEFEKLKISDEEFNSFVMRHREMSDILVPESNDDMENSYIMINPQGYIFQNKDNLYKKGKSLLEVQFNEALNEIEFSHEKFIARKGMY